MASASTTNNERTSSSGLNFGPQWMRNPPQQETFPQRQFPLAQYRYGREEMLAIFEQIASKQAELEPEGIPEVPADFPGMVDSFQQPVAYQTGRNEPRNEQEPRQNQSEIGQNSIIGRGRGRTFVSGQSRDNGWNGPSRNRRSEADFDWRKSGNGETSPLNDEWVGNSSTSPNNEWKGSVRPQPGNTLRSNHSNGHLWNKNRGPERWNRKMPEWLDTDTSEGGVFDNTGNFTEERRSTRSFDENVNSDSNAEQAGPPETPRGQPAQQVDAKEPPEDDEFDQSSVERAQQLQHRQQHQQRQQQQSGALLHQDNARLHGAAALTASAHQQQPVSQPTSMSNAQSTNSQWFEAINMEWFYKDPSNNIQGPFSSNDMGEWFEAGYFKKDLLIRRSCDQEFLVLGQVESRYGTNPFRSTRHPPAVLTQTQPPPPPPTISRPPGMSLHPQQAPLQQNTWQPGLMRQQPVMRTLSPIEQVIQLIQTSLEHQAVFKQLMQQITQLEQYSTLPPNHQETLVLQHMAAMYSITTPAPAQVNSQSNHVQGQTIAQNRQQHQPQKNNQVQVDQEEEIKKQMEQIRKEEEEKRKKEYEKRLEEEKQRAIEAAMKEKEAEFKRQQEALQKQEELLRQQKEKMELEEKKRLEEMKRLEEERKLEEERIRLAQEEARKKIEVAEALQREEEARRAELERQRLEQEEAQRRLKELRQRELEAERLIQEAEKERIRKEKAAEAEEKRRKKEEEKRLREKAKKEAEKKRLEEEEQKKLQEQVRQERLKKENEEKEKKRKALIKQQEEKSKAAPQWKTTSQASSHSVPSFAEIQKADQEEMKRQDKIRAHEMEKQKIAQHNSKSQAIKQTGAMNERPLSQTGWAGLVRGQTNRQTAPFSVVPVSPVVATKKTVQSTQVKKQSKTVQKQIKPKEELGFWDSAVDAVFTDKATVTNRMTQSSAKVAGTDAEKAHVRQLFEKLTVTQMEDPLLSWARVELDNIPNSQEVDIPTFVGFLRELENDYEVEDYARLYFGTGKGVLQFAQRFIEMRRRLKNQSSGQNGERKKGKKGSRKNKNKANPDLLGEH